MAVHPDFREFFALLNAKKVSYLIIGGVAYNYHAPPRATKDIDVWVEPSADNLERLIEAITEFGFPTDQLDPEVLAKTSKVLMLGRVPYRIDILTRPSGVEWTSSWASRIKGLYGDVSVSILGIEELIDSKVAAGRPHDLADVELLRRLSGG